MGGWKRKGGKDDSKVYDLSEQKNGGAFTVIGKYMWDEPVLEGKSV